MCAINTLKASDDGINDINDSPNPTDHILKFSAQYLPFWLSFIEFFKLGG